MKNTRNWERTLYYIFIIIITVLLLRDVICLLHAGAQPCFTSVPSVLIKFTVTRDHLPNFTANRVPCCACDICQRCQPNFCSCIVQSKGPVSVALEHDEKQLEELTMTLTMFYWIQGHLPNLTAAGRKGKRVVVRRERPIPNNSCHSTWTWAASPPS